MKKKDNNQKKLNIKKPLINLESTIDNTKTNWKNFYLKKHD